MKGLRVTKNVKAVKFEDLWGELKLKKNFERQYLTNYLRLTLVSMRNSAQPE